MDENQSLKPISPRYGHHPQQKLFPVAQEELLALMGLFGKMQMIVAEYVDAKGESGFVEVIDEDEHLEELERYRNPLA